MTNDRIPKNTTEKCFKNMNEEERQKIDERNKRIDRILERIRERHRIITERFNKTMAEFQETLEEAMKRSGYTKEDLENYEFEHGNDYQLWSQERIRTHMNQISMEKRRADIIAALMGQYACIRSTVALTNPDFDKILKIMKMEHTDENIYYIGDIAKSLLKIIRNEE